MYSLDKKYGLGKAPIRNTLGEIVHPFELTREGEGGTAIECRGTHHVGLDNLLRAEVHLEHVVHGLQPQPRHRPVSKGTSEHRDFLVDTNSVQNVASEPPNHQSG